MTMQFIASAVVSSNQTYIGQFSNIPQTFTHLEMRIFGRGTGAANQLDILVQVNNDISNANYRTHVLKGDGASATSSSTNADTFWNFPLIAGANATANVFGATVAQILDYTSTTKNKVFRAIGGTDNNGNGVAELRSGIYFNSTISPITAISFYVANAVPGSRVDLYGITTSAVTGA